MVSATDIITYIGVPLAVLDVMPILFTFLKRDDHRPGWDRKSPVNITSDEP
jgi:hypothetical protein